ncbi:MAG: hypothetical protein ACETWG_02020 [Candidatus Neomarinimicrobiota bacterium]
MISKRKMYYLSALPGIILLLMTGCSEGDPKLKVEPTELDFGTEATQKEFTIQNVGNDDGILQSGVKTLEYDIASNDSWISADPTSGDSDGEEDDITVTIDRTSLDTGYNTGEIDITSNGGDITIDVLAERQSPQDGHWYGQTSQYRDIFFDVSNQGTQIDEGMKIVIYCEEYWGTATVTLTRITPLDIINNEFTWSASGFSVNGIFENATHCTGNFSLSGNTGYPYYLSYSAAGTWATDWVSALKSLTKQVADTELIEGTEQYIEKIADSDAINITLNLRK